MRSSRYSLFYTCPAVVLFSVLAATGCSDLSATGGPRPLVKQELESNVTNRFSPLRLNEIAVYPLEADPTVRETISPEDLTRLSAKLADTLTLNTSIGITASGSKVDAGMKKIQNMHGSVSAKATAFGRAVGTPAVLYGVVSRYQENDGGKLGAEHSAAVRFRLWILDVATGDSLWEGSFDRMDKPLSENIFEIPSQMKNGVRYKQAMDLATEGFVSVAKDLENRRAEARAAEIHTKEARPS